MKRCLSKLPLALPAAILTVFVTLAGLLAAPATAQTTQRQFPQKALRGTLVVTAPPGVLLNDQTERLSPGARIRDSNNMLVLSASLVGQAVLVNYVRDPQGLIHEVWILNEREAQEERASTDSVKPLN